MIAFPSAARRRALVIKQRTRAGWVVVLRDYAKIANGRRAEGEPITFAEALTKARGWFVNCGLPVLIHPLNEPDRHMTVAELGRFVRATPYQSRPTLADIMDGPTDGGRAA